MPNETCPKWRKIAKRVREWRVIACCAFTAARKREETIAQLRQQLAECEKERDALLNSVDKSRESWAGAKVIGCYPDGSYLIDGRGGSRERVWFSADHEVLAEIRQQLAAVTRERDDLAAHIATQRYLAIIDALQDEDFKEPTP